MKLNSVNTLYEVTTVACNKTISHCIYSIIWCDGDAPCVTSKLLVLTLYLDMELAVDKLPLVIHHFKGVTSISIHVLITIRNATITEQKTHLMGGLSTQ